MGEGQDELALVMPDNSERRRRQQELDIRVIMGKPRYLHDRCTWRCELHYFDG